jgi:ribosomal protein L19E
MAITDEQIIDLAEGKPVEQVIEVLEENQEEEQEQETAKEEQQEEAHQEKKRRTAAEEIAHQRRGKQAEREEKERYQQELQAERAALAKEREDKKILQEFIKNFAEAKPDRAELDEPIDKEHFDRVDFQRIKDKIEASIEMEEIKGFAKYGDSYEQIKRNAIYREALELGELAFAAGENMTPDQLVKRAEVEFARKTEALARNGRSVLNYTAARAEQFVARAGLNKPAAKTGVNMDAVERVRKQAGAAEVKRSGGEINPVTLDSVLDQLDEAEAKRKRR